MNERMKILKEIAIKADLFREETKQLGKIAYKAFTEQDNSGKHKSQLKGLETIANSALKVSDVLDFIKRQTGRAKPELGWKKQQFGQQLLAKIETELKNRRNAICNQLNISDDAQKLEVYLLLIREFIRQVVIDYEYQIGVAQ